MDKAAGTMDAGNDAMPAAGESAGTSQTTGTTTKEASYRDGNYEASGAYKSPAGAEEINVTLIVANDVVTAVTIVPKAEHPISQRWQKVTADGIAQQVVGKSLDEIAVDNVSGSSLTPIGFMEALDKIRAQAQS
ncbi:MAG: hypothetical protein N2691_03835 [Patescibacteria group bacterium]|nr:hypothetical protein [Patescibacteria group bacterium]